MATVTSLTDEKIEELMSGWEGVSLSQGQINSLVQQLWNDAEARAAMLDDFQNNVIPTLRADLDAGSAAVSDLTTNVIPGLAQRLEHHDLNLQNLNTVDIPSLQESLSNNATWLMEFEEYTVPELQAQLTANTESLTNLNETTLPGLTQRLDTLEQNGGGFDPTELNAAIDALEQKFPIEGADIAASAVTANHILSHTITALQIAADTITANEIAADTITANEIAADSITASEIAVGTITALEIATGTITTNEIKSRTIVGEDIAVDTITALEIAGRTITALEIKSGTISANEIMANTITANQIKADTITANEIAADTITAAEIAAETITANEIATDAITTRTIAAGSITSNEILAGSIQAVSVDANSIATAILEAGVIQSQLNITGVLSIAGANMGWSQEEGLYLGNGTVFYGDGRTNRVESDLVTASLTVRDGLSIGGNADHHGTMMLANGITTPTAKMSLSQTWPKQQIFGDGNSDQAFIEPEVIDLDAAHWLIMFNYLGPCLRRVGKASGGWGGDLNLGEWKNNFYPHGGFCQSPTSYYILGTDNDRDTGFYIYKLDKQNVVMKEADLYVAPWTYFNPHRSSKLVWDGTKVGWIWTTPQGDLKLRWFAADLSGQVGNDVVLMSDVGAVHVGAAYLGPAQPGGTSRLWVSLRTGDGKMVRCFTTAGARVASEDFPRAGGTSIFALAYDANGGTNRLYHMDSIGTFWKYSNLVNGGTLNAQYTWYDGDNGVYPSGTIINGVDKSGQASGFHETAPSPLTSFALSKRAWPVVTAPPAPDELVTDVTQVDKANRIGIYASIGGTPSLQEYLPVGTRSLPQTDTLATGGVAAGASAVPSFATASVPAPGRVRSAAVDLAGLPLLDLYGSGAGRAGPLKWDANGRPLGHGEYSSNTAQAATSGQYVTRTGWAVRAASSTKSPVNGISHSGGVFTIGQAGLWLLAAGLHLPPPAAANFRRITAIFVNGTSVFAAEGAGVAAIQDVTPTVSGVYYLNAGDTVEIKGWHNSGTGVTFSTITERNFFSAYCLAAF